MNKTEYIFNVLIKIENTIYVNKKYNKYLKYFILK